MYSDKEKLTLSLWADPQNLLPRDDVFIDEDFEHLEALLVLLPGASDCMQP